MSAFLDLLSGGLGLWGTIEQSSFNEAARQEDIKNRAEAVGSVKGLLSNVPAIKQLGQSVTTGYEDRLNQAMSILANAGQQEFKDINTQYNEFAAAQKANAVNRGFAGTSLVPTALANVERGRSDSLGALRDRLTQQKIGTYGQFSGDVLNSQWQTGMAPIAYTTDVTNNAANLQAGWPVTAQQSQYLALSQVAASLRPPPETPQPQTDLAGPLIGAGGAIASSAIMGVSL